MQLALFPLHAVLCPGVALPLHIFEDRYRLMIDRCIERMEPFGVVLIREGRETGRLEGRLSEIGTTALIRQASRIGDGRMNIMTVGGRRFRIDGLDEKSEPYLVADVELLEEPIGDELAAHQYAQRVSQHFLRYLELLQPALASDPGPEIEIEVEVETIDPEETDDPSVTDDSSLAADPTGGGLSAASEPPPTEDAGAAGLADGVFRRAATDAERHELLMAAARRLAVPDDPATLGYVLGGLVHIDLGTRQALLEARDAASRLQQLDAVLTREIQFLSRRLKPLAIDPRLTALRKN
jgi:Lon protease-like protein